MSKNAKIYLFTDGACSGNPGPGGWGAILRWNGHEKELSGHAPDTTNNRMELQAVIEGLRSIKKDGANVHVCTDSKYVMQGATEWMAGWQRKGWRGANNKPVKNVDLWQELDVQLQRFSIEWEWVKGHDGHPENERADALATGAIQR